MSKLSQNELVILWEELEDVCFDIRENGELYLSDNWNCFEKGTSRTDIWEWFDKQLENGFQDLICMKYMFEINN